MKVLLTGGAGYIGTHIAVELINAGHDVIIADDYSNSYPEAIHRVEELTNQKIKTYTVDVTDRDKTEVIFKENKIDGVIHLAGFKAVGESVKIPLKYYRNNLDSALTILELMKDYGVSCFVFSSSATVYGEPESVPMTEDMKKGVCTSSYAWTKSMIEQIATDAANADPDLSVVLLRYFNPIGAHESGRIGEDPEGIPNNLMPRLTQTAIGKMEYLTIFGTDYPTKDGTGVRDYIHVVDLAKGHVAAIEYAAANKGCELFNLGTGIGYTVLDLVYTFEKVNGMKIPTKVTKRRPGDIAEYYSSAEKAERMLHWKAERTLEDMCRDSWNWQKNNPKGYREDQ